MDDKRDMFYSNFGYQSDYPAQMMPNMYPMMMPQNIGGQQMGYPNEYYGNSGCGDLNNKVERLERQIKILEQRVTRLETLYSGSSNTTNIYNEPDSNMYMM